MSTHLPVSLLPAAVRSNESSCARALRARGGMRVGMEGGARSARYVGCRCHPASLGSRRRVVFAPVPALLQTGRLPTAYPTGIRLCSDQVSKSTSVVRLTMPCAIDAMDVEFAYACARRAAAASAIGTDRRAESIPTATLMWARARRYLPAGRPGGAVRPT